VSSLVSGIGDVQEERIQLQKRKICINLGIFVINQDPEINV